MRTGVFGPALALLLMVAAVPAAATCSVARVAGAEAVLPANGRIEQRLIDAAIRAEVNFHRCKAGMRKLGAASGLASVAANHAKWMARAGTVSHRSAVAGQSTLKARMSSSGVRFRAGSENIGMVHRYALEGDSYRILDARACRFADAAGRPIGAHSYASLAERMVGYWMASPGHRKNILDRRVKVTGAGAGLAVGGGHCGQFYLSQNFAG